MEDGGEVGLVLVRDEDLGNSGTWEEEGLVLGDIDAVEADHVLGLR